MPEGSADDLHDRRDRRRRNRRIASGVVAFMVAAVGAFAAFAAFSDTGPHPRPAVSPPVLGADRISVPSSSLQFVDERHGWMAFDGYLLATSDGGKTWRSQAPGKEILGVQFFDRQRGWAAGDGLYKTTDGGAEWRLVSKSPVDQVQFVDSTVGWSVQVSSDPRKSLPLPEGFHTAEGYLVLFKTTDGGSTWDRVEIKRTVSAICFADETTGWAASQRSILWTTDGGKSWGETDLNLHDGVFWRDSISCPANKKAWALFEGNGTAGTIPYVAFVTTGGGRWEPVMQERSTSHISEGRIYGSEDPYPGPFDTPSPRAAFFLTSCPPCGGTSAVTRTLDGGKTWQRFDLPGDVRGEPIGLSFIDAQNGWAVINGTVPNDEGETPDFFVLKTSDGGESWKMLSVSRRPS